MECIVGRGGCGRMGITLLFTYSNPALSEILQVGKICLVQYVFEAEI